jgi:hypothetical protein
MSFTFSWVSTPGQNNNFVNGSVNGGGRARAIRDDGKVDPFDSPLYICIPPITFQGGNAGAATLFDFAKLITTCGPNTIVQQPALNYNGKRIGGGALRINDNPCGNYEFNLLAGGTTLEQTDVANLFSTANDVSSWIVCRGDLTLGSNVTLIPTVTSGYTRNDPINTDADASAKRRLFMVIYVTGNLTFGSDTLISMSACGGNSSSAGANIASFEIPVANGLTGSIDVKIAAAGDTPTAPDGNTASGLPGPPGTIVSNVYSTGGGGSGFVTGAEFPIANPPGSGGAGSCFSGGTGGGSASKLDTTLPTSGSSLGGIGGTTGNTVSGGYGGTGNPGGLGANTGISGTGGILIVIVGGTMSGTGDGRLAANGVTNGPTNSGGASGGGIILQLSGSGTYNLNTFTAGGTRNTAQSGAGGAGTTGNYTL